MDTGPVASAVTAGIGRRDVLTAGVGAALALATLTENASAAAAAKSGWRYCPECRGLFAGKGSDAVGVCPAGGAHKPLKGYNYLLLSGLSVEDSNFPKNWVRCKKCRGLFQDNAGAISVCPSGGAHVRTGSQYGLWIGGAPPFPPFMERTGTGAACVKGCSGLATATASVPRAGRIRAADSTSC